MTSKPVMNAAIRCTCRNAPANGFTLIELMIVVAVVGLLATIAYPNYQKYVQRGRRADAKGTVVEMAQFMERYYSENNSYSSASLPATTSPREGSAVYDIRFGSSCTDGAVSVTTSPESSCFLVQAVPIAGAAMDGDQCGTLGIDNTGNKTATGSAGALQCWGR
jgi:type IV pilus assembly protein PilE